MSKQEKSFIPFNKISHETNGGTDPKSQVHRVIKKEKVTAQGQYLIPQEKHANEQGEIMCEPVLKDGVVSAITVKCGCGETTRIDLQYE